MLPQQFERLQGRIRVAPLNMADQTGRQSRTGRQFANRQAPFGPQCTKAADCTGPLPDICEICSNGKSECAHHACESGVCVMEICN